MAAIPALALTAALLLLAPTLSSAVEGTVLPPLTDPATEYGQRDARTDPARCANPGPLLLPVTPSAARELQVDVDQTGDHLRILYRMAFNQVTEGWNWHPESLQSGEDYYRYQYLPVKSVFEDKSGYRQEDKIGDAQDVQVRWRHDYFFAFDNLYDFYPRTTADDAGFAAEVIVPHGDAGRLLTGDLRMALRGHLTEPCLADSTTFWKATFGTPVDFTLRKHYLMGKLDEVLFYDNASRHILARLPAEPSMRPPGNTGNR